MEIKIFKSSREFIKETIKFILASKPKTIALSGGKTPEPIYKALNKKFKDLEEIQFYQVDERYVPKNHPDSNYNLVKKTLFNKNPKHLKNFHHFDTNLSIKKSLQKYQKQLPKTFDLCILGIGEDGHSASLFPHSPALSTKSPLAHTTTDQFKVHDRLTITFPLILKSKTILILLKNKPEILKELKKPTKPFKQFPALKLLKHKNLHIHFLNKC